MTNQTVHLYLAILSTLLFSSQAQANLSGNWIGWGDWSYEGSATHCPEVRLLISETPTEIKRLSGHFECDYVSQDQGELRLTKKETDLWMDNERVGTQNGSHYEWIENYSPTIKIEVQIDRVAGHLDYQERWIGKDEKVIYLIESRLFSGNADATAMHFHD